MKFIQRILTVAGLAVLSGCVAGGQWEVNYSDNGRAVAENNWRVARVSIAVPSDLSVSEENRFAPDADIVWRGEPEGDRHAQVQQIFQEAAQQAASRTSGRNAVELRIQVHTFHALSDLARAKAPAGVHNIGFIAEVVDISSGEVLVPEEDISADLRAYVGEQAVAEEVIGNTQRVRIVAHLAEVITAWLGESDDIRKTFTLPGR